MDFYPPLTPGSCYHIYNRGNNRENLFYKHENYLYFLRQYNYYLNDYLETFAYCLLPNHFHLLVRVKDPNHIPSLSDLECISPAETVSDQFRKLFMSYAKAINKQENRTGSLFQKNFKRKLVENERYFTRLIYYIHANPQLHDIHPDFTNYPYSSYESLLSFKPTKLQRDETMAWFGDRDACRTFHAQPQRDNAINKWIIED